MWWLSNIAGIIFSLIFQAKNFLLIFLFILTGVLESKSQLEDFSFKPVEKSDSFAVDYKDLRLNEIQIIASHNSYRQMTTMRIYRFLRLFSFLLPGEYNPRGLNYEHPEIEIQLDKYGVRGLEMDVYYDPAGGAFSKRKMNSYLGLPAKARIPELDSAGFKILHIKDVDYNTHYYTFRQAIQAVKDWSDKHPEHLPIFINVETKSLTPGSFRLLRWLGFKPAPAYDEHSAEVFDAELRSVFGPELEKLITPDKLRGELPTLNDVVKQHEWLKMDECLGKIVFIIEGDMVEYYLKNHPSLAGRAAFVYADAGKEESVFVLINDAVRDFIKIQQLVLQGYIVRTRCDTNTREARKCDYRRMNAAFTSGAQINSTDYYQSCRQKENKKKRTYCVEFPGKVVARKNPLLFPDAGK